MLSFNKCSRCSDMVRTHLSKNNHGGYEKLGKLLILLTSHFKEVDDIHIWTFGHQQVIPYKRMFVLRSPYFRVVDLCSQIPFVGDLRSKTTLFQMLKESKTATRLDPREIQQSCYFRSSLFFFFYLCSFVNLLFFLFLSFLFSFPTFILKDKI